MKSEHRAYEKEFKIEAARLVQMSKKSISQVARATGGDRSIACVATPTTTHRKKYYYE